MNNIKFVQHAHFCVVCKSEINMFKIERQIFEAMRYEHKPGLMPPLKDNDPVVIGDFGNDIEIVCSKKCLCEYLGLRFFLQ